MINNSFPVYLASKSPRRKELLQLIVKHIKIISVDTPEKIIPNESPLKTVKRIAKEKMEAALLNAPKTGIIITADTVVVCENHILGKPRNAADGQKMLKLLSDNEHFVYTGFCVRNLNNGKEILSHDKTGLRFRKISDKEIREYIATGGPLDKAGAYGIQDGYGAVFTEKINGCYYNVMGLPLSKLQESILKVLE